MKKVLYITGTRADFALMRSTLEEMKRSPSLELGVLVTGMHLLRSRGRTELQINEDFEVVGKVPVILEESGTNWEMAAATGRAVVGVADVIKKVEPEILLVQGDRTEALAGALAGALMNIVVVHVGGGDVTGSIDESLRHAITKLAHLHLAETEESAERIRRMGEEPWRVRVVGRPIARALAPREELDQLLGIDASQEVILLIQHPVTTQSSEAGEQMRETMEAVVPLGQPVVAIYPNSDAGAEDMLEVLKEYEEFPNVWAFPNLAGPLFMRLLSTAGVVVGNSSVGIVEAPFFDVPAVNVGTRQKGRQRGENVIDVEHDAARIREAVETALSEKFRSQLRKSDNPYDSADVERNIREALEDLTIQPRVLQKRMTY